MITVIFLTSLVTLCSCAPIHPPHPAPAYFWKELVDYGFCEFQMQTIDLGEDLGKVEEISCTTEKANCVQIHEDIGGFLVKRGCVYLNRLPVNTVAEEAGPSTVA